MTGESLRESPKRIQKCNKCGQRYSEDEKKEFGGICQWIDCDGKIVGKVRNAV